MKPKRVKIGNYRYLEDMRVAVRILAMCGLVSVVEAVEQDTNLLALFAESPRRKKAASSVEEKVS